MNKPNNYDQTKTGTGFTPVVLGGHRGIIKAVEETQSKSGKDMIIVYVDLAAEDAQPRYFTEQYQNDTRSPKKWPYQATQYILTEDSSGNTGRSFKAFCTSYEDSNGVSIRWGGNNWADQFKGKRIGIVFGEVEEEYNGEIKTRRRIRWFCDDHKALDADVPAKKFANQSAPVSSSQADPTDVWMPTDFSNGDELPFR